MRDFHRFCGKLETVSGGWKAELLVVSALCWLKKKKKRLGHSTDIKLQRMINLVYFSQWYCDYAILVQIITKKTFNNFSLWLHVANQLKMLVRHGMVQRHWRGKKDFADPFMTLRSNAASATQLKCMAPCDTELRSPLLALITLPNWGLSFSWTNCPTWKKNKQASLQIDTYTQTTLQKFVPIFFLKTYSAKNSEEKKIIITRILSSTDVLRNVFSTKWAY